MNNALNGCIARVAAATDIGRVRTTNEDAFVVTSLGAPVVARESRVEAVFDTRGRPLLLAVSDGMGGAAAGEVASALVVESLRRRLPTESADWDKAIQNAVEQANREVWNAAQAPERRGMGATLTAVCVHGLEAHVAEVGDSRAYRLRGQQLDLLTHDQSYVQMLLDAGALTPEEAAVSPMKNVILSAMGTKPDVRVDLGRVAVAPGDRLLVCCDGLSNEVPHDRIAEVLRQAASPASACTTLVQLANDHGGNDNITVVVAFLEHSQSGP